MRFLQKIILSVYALSAFSIASAPAIADQFDIVGDCQKAVLVAEKRSYDPTDPSFLLGAGSCAGFVQGFLSTLAYNGGPLRQGKGAFCPSAVPTVMEIIYVFNGYIVRNPHMRLVARNHPAAAFISSLQESWPCRTK